MKVDRRLADSVLVRRASIDLCIPVAQAIGHFVALWGALADADRDGELASLPDTVIEDWACWDGEAVSDRNGYGRYARYVREFHLDENGRVKDWDKWAGSLTKQRNQNAERQQRYRDRHGSPKPSHNGARNALRNALDKSRVDKKELPIASVDATPAEARAARVLRAKPERPSWTTRFADELAKHRGGVAQYGVVGKHLKPLVARDGEDALWPMWQRFCSGSKAMYGAAWFAANLVEFTGAPVPGKDTDDAIAARIRARLSPGPQFHNNWDLETATPDERRVFAARGGAYHIWNDTNQRRHA